MVNSLANKPGQGRPRTDIPIDVIDVACQFNASVNQVLEILAQRGIKISEDTLSNFIKREFGLKFSDYRDKKVDLTRLKLVQKAVKMALDGNATMLIFCLKNLCNWRDRNDPTPTDGVQPIPIAYVPKSLRAEAMKEVEAVATRLDESKDDAD